MKEDVNLPEEEHLKDIKKQIETIFNAGTKECLITVLSCMNVE